MDFNLPHPLITCDTNVYISGATLSQTPPGQIIQAWRDDQIELALSEPILDEIEDVLTRPYFVEKVGWTAKKAREYRAELTASGVIVPGITLVDVCRDPKDNMVFACALEAKSDFIVSGDKDVLEVGTFESIPVVTPREFVEVNFVHPKKAA